MAAYKVSERWIFGKGWKWAVVDRDNEIIAYSEFKDRMEERARIWNGEKAQSGASIEA